MFPWSTPRENVTGYSTFRWYCSLGGRLTSDVCFLQNNQRNSAHWFRAYVSLIIQGGCNCDFGWFNEQHCKKWTR